MRSATCLTRRPFGFSDDTSESMNSKADRPRVRLGRLHPHALVADHDPVAHPDAVHRDGAGPCRRPPTTRPQSISGFATGTQCPSRRTSEGRLVVE